MNTLEQVAAPARIDTTLSVAASAGAFLELRAAWDEILDSPADATICQSFEWQSLWWKHFGAGKELRIAVVRRGGRIDAVVPMYAERLFGSGVRMGLMGEGDAYAVSGGLFHDNGPSDYLDAIVRPGAEEDAAEAVAGWLARESRHAAIDLTNLREEGFLFRRVVPRLEGCAVRKADICPHLPLPSSKEAFMAALSASVRRRLAQSERAASGEERLFTLRTMGTIEERREALALLAGLHQRRWNRAGFPGLFADGRFRAFQEELLAALHARGRVWCMTAEAGGACVAGRLAFIMNGVYYDYLSGFDDEAPAARRRPGLALLVRMIADGIAAGARSVDFLRGDEEYKFDLTKTAHYNWNVTLGGRARAGMAGAISSRLRFARWLIARERRLFAVQRRMRGALGAVPGYLAFRMPRLARKLGKNA